ncbi:uncharacterized protein LOC119840033 [Zerene cesonia]|uniref:uncharacterized protein LOC119840033 n=1 Tax=Zerene cesonia TaxID=33412 RepID=UPI0018E4EA8A|nr:uncharacterized protein LOC119840033 [Zerene cesonia]
MAAGNIYIYVLTALLAIHFILAEQQEQGTGGDNDGNRKWSLGFSWGRLANDTRDNNRPRSPRSPFSFLPSMGSCNYTTEPGFTCSGCSTVRVCLPNNVSISRNCGIFLPYCDNGHCASSPSSSCNGTASA